MKKEMALAAALIATPLTAQAEDHLVCAPLDTMISALEQLGEDVKSAAVSKTGYLKLEFASNAGSYTVVFVDPEKTACVVDTGDGWAEYKGPAPGIDH